MENLRAIMEAAGGTLDDVQSVQVYMKDMARDKDGFEEAYRAFFPNRFPARALVGVNEIPLVNEETIVEIRAIGVIARKKPVASS
jgi:2-iminobutanoate/2-iminopropanoate deaminase